MLVVTTAAYWQGLSGGYTFDDIPNFVDNPAVHVTTLNWSDWKRAIRASPSQALARPLAFISLATNYYFTGLDPFPIKLTNLCIHLLNGLLLFRIALQLLRLVQQSDDNSPAQDDDTLPIKAAVISGAWLLAPINVTSVLYVIQRMESLANTFVLAGLLVYLLGRQHMIRDGSGGIRTALGLVTGTAVGILAKESAALLPLYAGLTEVAILRFRAATRPARIQLVLIYSCLLILPMAFAAIHYAPRWLSPAAYQNRSFTLAERLMTESRILFDYMRWTLLPAPNALTFYHDDIRLSKGWLKPPSTLASTLGLLALLSSAAVARRKLPLYALGIFWFFAAHLLTGTIIPLELAFEHRNYFASSGLLLAITGLVLAVPKLPRSGRAAIAGTALIGFAAVTSIRATEWSDPITLAFAEASKRPESPRANYTLGQTLIAASNYRADSPFLAPGIAAFQRAADLPTSSAWANAALVVINGRVYGKVDKSQWTSLIRKLTESPPSSETIAAIEAINNCQDRGKCPIQTDYLSAAYLAALNHPRPPWRLLAAYGGFAANTLHDYPLAEKLFTEALSKRPKDQQLRINIASTQLLQGKVNACRRTLSKIEPDELLPNQRRRIQILTQQVTSQPPDP